jgi:hypothetical protein
MQLHPRLIQPGDEEFLVAVNPGAGKPFATIQMGGLEIWPDSAEDCDRIVRAAVEAKRMLEVATACTPHPHQQREGGPYTTHCGHCGLLPRDEIHDEIVDATIDDDGDEGGPMDDEAELRRAEQIREGEPAACGARPYPAGSEGDDGTECALPAGHEGEHDDSPAPSAFVTEVGGVPVSAAFGLVAS